MEPPTEKSCTKCGVVKPLDEFSRRASAKYGRTPWCKTCIAEQSAARYAAKKAAGDQWDPDVDTKECNECGETKLLREFARHAAGLKGRKSYCHPCFAAQNRERADSRQGSFDHLDPDTTTKQCLGCELELPLRSFHRQANGALGRTARCRACCGYDDERDLRDRPTWGYQHVWKGQVVYVGITCDLGHRNATHRTGSPWYTACVEPTEDTSILFPDRTAAEEWERETIRGLVADGHVLLNNMFNVVNTLMERATLLGTILLDQRANVERL